MRVVLCAIGLAGALWMPVNASAQSWAEYRPKEVGLRVEMPGKPKLEQQKTKAGNISNRAIVAYRDMAFMLNYGEKNDTPRPDTEVVLDAVVKEMLQGSKVLSSKKEMISGFPARPAHRRLSRSRTVRQRWAAPRPMPRARGHSPRVRAWTRAPTVSA